MWRFNPFASTVFWFERQVMRCKFRFVHGTPRTITSAMGFQVSIR